MSIEQQASLLNTKNSLDMQIGGKIQSNLPDKELIMTKLQNLYFLYLQIQKKKRGEKNTIYYN